MADYTLFQHPQSRDNCLTSIGAQGPVRHTNDTPARRFNASITNSVSGFVRRPSMMPAVALKSNLQGRKGKVNPVSANLELKLIRDTQINQDMLCHDFNVGSVSALNFSRIKPRTVERLRPRFIVTAPRTELAAGLARRHGSMLPTTAALNLAALSSLPLPLTTRRAKAGFLRRLDREGGAATKTGLCRGRRLIAVHRAGTSCEARWRAGSRTVSDIAGKLCLLSFRKSVCAGCQRVGGQENHNTGPSAGSSLPRDPAGGRLPAPTTPDQRYSGSRTSRGRRLRPVVPRSTTTPAARNH